MTEIASKGGLPISPGTVLLSGLFHVLVIAAVVLTLPQFNEPEKPPKPLEAESIRVTSVDWPIEPPRPDTVPEPIPEANNPPEQEIKPEIAKPEPEPTRRTIKAVKAKSEKPPEIKIKKRKRKPARIAAAEPEAKPRSKTEPKPEPEPEDSPETEDSSEDWDRRREVEQLQERIRQRRYAQAQRPDTPRAAVTPGDPQRGDTEASQELYRWLAQVRDLINQHWAVFHDRRNHGRETIVAVDIASNGELLTASIDKRSGDSVLDRSALRAVQDAAPYPPIPREVHEQIRKAGGLALRFTPYGAR